MCFVLYPNGMSDEEFERAVESGINELPEWVIHKFENLVFFVKDDVSQAQRKENELNEDDTLFGLYEGVPLSERGNTRPSIPDTITIFKNPILSACNGEVEIRRCISNTLWHEVAHYFGHDEEWVRTEEKRRGKSM